MLLRMARKLRVEYPGALDHVLNRGDRREPIFKDDRDRKMAERLRLGSRNDANLLLRQAAEGRRVVSSQT
jgi:hypothetical protein